MAFSLRRLLGTPKTLGSDPIFVFASGNRCGSTLLQRVLNSHPDMLIWGEHRGYLSGFFAAGEDLVDWAFDKAGELYRYNRDGYDNFIPNLSPTPEHIRRTIARHVEMLFAEPGRELGKQIWGFKEVRYPASVALSLQECFPGARFIHLTRRIDDCLRSLRGWEASGNWNSAWTRQSMDNWVLVNKSFLAEGHKLNQLLHLRYEDMVGIQPMEFAATLANFLHTKAESFDLGVFGNKLAGTGHLATSTQLSDEDVAALSTPNIRRLNEAFQY